MAPDVKPSVPAIALLQAISKGRNHQESNPPVPTPALCPPLVLPRTVPFGPGTTLTLFIYLANWGFLARYRATSRSARASTEASDTAADATVEAPRKASAPTPVTIR